MRINCKVSYVTQIDRCAAIDCTECGSGAVGQRTSTEVSLFDVEQNGSVQLDFEEPLADLFKVGKQYIIEIKPVDPDENDSAIEKAFESVREAAYREAREECDELYGELNAASDREKALTDQFFKSLMSVVETAHKAAMVDPVPTTGDGIQEAVLAAVEKSS